MSMRSYGGLGAETLKKFGGGQRQWALGYPLAPLERGNSLLRLECPRLGPRRIFWSAWNLGKAEVQCRPLFRRAAVAVAAFWGALDAKWHRFACRGRRFEDGGACRICTCKVVQWWYNWWLSKAFRSPKSDRMKTCRGTARVPTAPVGRGMGRGLLTEACQAQGDSNIVQAIYHGWKGPW